MVAVRMQRIGRKGQPMYRIVVQESRFRPTSGRFIAHIGNYNPHTKVANVDVELVQKYLNNGAQPSQMVTRVLSANGVTMPAWIEKSTQKTKSVKNSDKLRKHQPKEEPVAEEPTAEATETTEAETTEA